MGDFKIHLPISTHSSGKSQRFSPRMMSLIENNKRRIALLEKLAEEIYREWFVRLRFPGHEKVKLVKDVPHC